MVPDRDDYTIPEFCAAHGFSRATYYNIPPEDRPREMQVRGCKLISREAGAEWRRRMETRGAKEDRPA